MTDLHRPVSNPPRATRITIEWEDGMVHHFARRPDGSWDLRLTEPSTGPTISGYDGPNVMRIMGTALGTTEVAGSSPTSTRRLGKCPRDTPGCILADCSCAPGKACFGPNAPRHQDMG